MGTWVDNSAASLDTTVSGIVQEYDTWWRGLWRRAYGGSEVSSAAWPSPQPRGARAPRRLGCGGLDGNQTVGDGQGAAGAPAGLGINVG